GSNVSRLKSPFMAIRSSLRSAGVDDAALETDAQVFAQPVHEVGLAPRRFQAVEDSHLASAFGARGDLPRTRVGELQVAGLAAGAIGEQRLEPCKGRADDRV